MRYVLTSDADEFAAHTERFLAEHIECNLLATVLIRILDGGHRDPPPVFAYGLAPESGGDVAFAALRTPPWPLLSSPLGPGARTTSSSSGWQSIRTSLPSPPFRPPPARSRRPGRGGPAEQSTPACARRCTYSRRCTTHSVRPRALSGPRARMNAICWSPGWRSSFARRVSRASRRPAPGSTEACAATGSSYGKTISRYR